MNLEQRYRRLLLAYPPTYRAERGDEIVGVLLDSAAPGQARPTIADSFDLVRGGLSARVRHRRPYRSTSWPDALAVITVVLPIALGARAYRYAYLLHRFRDQIELGRASADAPSVQWYFDGWAGPTLWLVAAIVVIAGRPRAALVVASVATALEAVHLVTGVGTAVRPVLVGVLPFLVLELMATALLASASRVRRGLEVVGRGRLALATLAAGVLYVVALAPGTSEWTQSYSGSGLLALTTVMVLVTVLIRGDVGLRVGAMGVALASVVVATRLIETTFGHRPTSAAAIAVEAAVTVGAPIVVMGVILLGARVVRAGGSLVRRS